MPWHIGKSQKCPDSKPFAVIKDGDGGVSGCHTSKEGAKKQLAALYASEERSMSKLEQLRARFIRWFDKEIEQEDREQARSVVEVKRQKDGRYRWFSISATTAINKDGEIDSRELFDTMVAVARMTNVYPKRDFMHLGDMGEQFHVGQTDFMARDGNTLITSGLYFDNDLATMEIQARQRNPDFWGDSIHFIPLDHPEVEEIGDSAVPIWRVGKIKFVSTVPRSIASSLFVTGEVKEAKRMLQKMELEAFVSLFGDENAARSWLEANADGINRLIEDEAIITRSVDEVEETVVPEVEAEPEVEVARAETAPEPEVDVVEIGDEVVETIVQRVAESKAITALFHKLDEQLEAVNQAIAVLGVLTEKERGKLSARLAELEKEDELKFVEMLDDMPRKRQVSVAFRPSQNANDTVEASLADRAESVVAALGDDSLYPKN